MATLIAAQVALALLNMAVYEPRPILAEALVQAHVSIGVVLFVLTVARIFSRAISERPEGSNSRAIQYAATFSHSLLYLCLLTLPITGYLKLAALGFTITPFGLFALPDLPLNVPVAQAADQAHDVIARLLGALLVLHITAALCHRRLDGRDVWQHIAIGNRGKKQNG